MAGAHGGKMIVPTGSTRTASLCCGLCIILLMVTSIRFVDANSKTMTSVLDTVLMDYDNRIRPHGVGGNSSSEDSSADSPVYIRVELFIESVDSIKESTMDFSLTIYLRMFWLDSRLAFNGSRNLVLGSHGIENIWVPDIYFLYEKNARIHTVTQINRLMQIQPTGNLSYSARISLTVACNMQLQKFPMDSQNCSLILSSYAYTTEDLILLIDNKSISKEPDITISKFKMTSIGVEHNNLEYSLGNFSSVKCHFFFVRQMESYFLTVYIPSVLLVSIAWLSFWIDAKAAPARVALGITTVLTMTTTTAGIQETLPVVTYAKAIDIWLVVSLMFVFFSLIEYGMANYLLVKQAKDTSPSNEPTESGMPDEEGGKSSTHSYRMTANRLDHYARWIYPIAFLSFCVCYWMVVLMM